MPFRFNPRRLLWLALPLFATLLPAQDRARDLAIVVNKALKLVEISSADLQHFFKADKTRAPDGTKLVIVMHDTGRPERAAALSAIYRMSEREYVDYFVEATFTGAVASAPKAFASPAAVKKFVAETPGAIGYLRATDVDDSVKEIKVDGKAAGTAGYSLKVK